MRIDASGGYWLPAIALIFIVAGDKAAAADSECGRPTLSADAAGGELVSYAGYPHSAVAANASWLNCAWQLDSPPGSALALEFQSLSLAAPDDCVQLADPAGRSSQLSACGSTAAAAAAAAGYVSTGPVVSLRARLTAGSVGTGFRLIYRFYKPADCTRQVRLSGENGTVTGNRYLAGNWCPDGLTWRWSFAASKSGGEGGGFVLHILKASLDSGDCLVVAASGSGGSELARRCGSAAKPEILHWSGAELAAAGGLTLTFSAASPVGNDDNRRWNSSGFSVQYARVTVCANNGQSLDASRTSALEHRPANYSGWYFCSWTLAAPAGQKMAYRLESTELPGCLTAAGDDGSWSRQCHGDVAVREPIVSDRVSRLSYLSGAEAVDSGFKVAWNLANSYCGQLARNSSSNSGQLSSHSSYSTAAYPANLRCNWTLAFVPGSSVLISVNRLSLADASDCLIFTEAASVSKFCGPANVYSNASFSVSSSDGLTIHFVTDSRGGAEGFQLGVRAVPTASAKSACNATVINVDASAGSGYVISHAGYGEEPYPNNANCAWQISTSPGAGQLIAWFEDLLLEACCDRVFVYDGPMESPSRRLLGSASAETAQWPSRTVYSASGQVLSVRFTSDALGTSRGFRMRYSTVARLRRDCSTENNLTEPSGRIQSHADLGLVGYAGNSSCQWSVPVSPTRLLLIRFDLISLRPGDCLSVSNASMEFKRYCGVADGLDGQSRQLLLSTGSSPIAVRLEAPTMDGAYTGAEDRKRGFALRYFWVKTCPQNGRTIENGEGTIGSYFSNATAVDKDTYYFCSWRFKPADSKKLVYRFESANFPSVNSSAMIDAKSTAGENTSQVFSGSVPSTLPAQAVSADVAEATFGLVLKSVERDFLIRYFIGDVCGRLTWTNDTSGRLSSHSVDPFSLPAIQNVTCSWRVAVPADKQLTVQSPTGSGFLLSGSGDCLSFYGGSGVALRSYCGGGWRRVNLTVSQADLRIELRLASLLQPPIPLDLALTALDSADTGCASAEVVDLAGPRGSFASHRRLGQLGYRRGQTCAWRIPSGANGVNLRLSSVSLHPGDCLDVQLENGSVLTQLCGSNATDRALRWDKLAGPLRLRFSAPTAAANAPESPNPPAGFGVKFDNGVACGTLSWNSNGSGGALVSHVNYGFTRYPPGLLCLWRIEARPAYAVAIDVGMLQLSDGDCLHFYEASQQPPARVGSHCGRDFNGSLAPALASLRTADSQLLVEFDSRADSAGGVGFGLTFRLLERPVCSGSSRIWTAPTAASPPANLASHPGFNRWNYAANTRCYAEVRAPSADGRVSAWFAPGAELEAADRDYVMLFDGASATSGKLIRTYVDSENSSEKSSSDVLGVLFSTDYSVEAAGFQLLFFASQPSQQFPLAAVIGGSVAGLAILCLIIALIVLARTNKLQCSGTTGHRNSNIELEDQTGSSGSRSKETGSANRPVNHYSHPLPVAQRTPVPTVQSSFDDEFDQDDYTRPDRFEGQTERQNPNSASGTGSVSGAATKSRQPPPQKPAKPGNGPGPADNSSRVTPDRIAAFKSQAESARPLPSVPSDGTQKQTTSEPTVYQNIAEQPNQEAGEDAYDVYENNEPDDRQG